MPSITDKQLIHTFDFSLSSPACHPGAATWSINVTFEQNITDLLPLLNAELRCADYDQKADCLIWKTDRKKYAFRPTQISVAPVSDREDALPMAQEAVDIVNDVWRRRAMIEPDYTRVKRPGLMEVYRTLRKDNCGECGYPTCMAFAGAHSSGKAQAGDCPHLASQPDQR